MQDCGNSIELLQFCAEHVMMVVTVTEFTQNNVNPHTISMA